MTYTLGEAPLLNRFYHSFKKKIIMDTHGLPMQWRSSQKFRFFRRSRLHSSPYPASWAGFLLIHDAL
ncbi:hypothetical protein D3OALGA1CA_2209 [Olavius algarvensis associated proteobacterium Delta 3]|nr:hypothetical protein D3OALGB2SA_2163 [Olavius algarvensis associated proteobacterium Delta 3]CAB5115037.1 hypothetical protein D3OALGA1CA_2209 [Olavius algarvensis associated proteobacterium Delta 3]